MASNMEGVIQHDGSPLPVCNLRLRAGILSAVDEIENLIMSLVERKQDHLNWIETLRRQVEDGAPITVQTDPHQCAFGKWYDRRKVNSYALSQYMDRFDTPHKAIHGIALEAQSLMRERNIEGARELIHRANIDIMEPLMALFNGAGEVIRSTTHQYVIVVEDNDHSAFGLLVDDLDQFGTLEESIVPLPAIAREGEALATAMGRIGAIEARRNVLLLDIDRILGQG